MGLDVTLKHCINLAAAKAREEQGQEREEAFWTDVGGYDQATEEQRQDIRQKTKDLYTELNLCEWGQASEIETIEENSAKYPEHMFKVGYLRSSYNSGGINSVLKRCGCPDLYDIFEPNEEYTVKPDWNVAQTRVVEAIESLSKHMDSEMAKYDVQTITDLMGLGGVKDANEALAVFQTQLKNKRPDGFNSYGCRDGDFFLEGKTIVGVIPNRGFGGGVHLITRNDDQQSNLKWYMEALEVTKETIDFVLSKDDPENYYFSWSA